MPLDAADLTVLDLDLVEHLAALPVPKGDVATRISAGQELAVGADVDVYGASGVVVAAVALLAVLAEFVVARIDDDLVVGALVGDVLARGVGGSAGHGEQVRLSNVLYGDAEAVLPGAEGAVVRRRHEAPAVVAKCDGVDGPQVVVVLLHRLVARPSVELHNLVIRHAGDKLVTELRRRVEAHHVWRLARCELGDALARLRVPELHHAVERSR